MERWIDELAEALGEAPLSNVETERLLRAARDVAHRVERRITPLSTFLLGEAVGRAVGGGSAREQALDGVLETVTTLLPPEAGQRGPDRR